MSDVFKSISEILAKQQQLLGSPSDVQLRQALRFLYNYQVKGIKKQSYSDITRLMKIINSFFFLQTPFKPLITQIYQKFVSELSGLRHYECNNFATMLYNMKAYTLLQKNEDRDSIMGFMLKISQYDQQRNNSDLELIVLNLTNMAVLYLDEEQYQKSFTYSLKAYQNIKQHLLILKRNKNTDLANKVTIFVNACYLIKQSLYGRVNSNQISPKDKKQYLEYIQLFHNQGEKAAKKYLGNESYLMKLLKKRQQLNLSVNFSKDVVWKHELPVFHINQSDLAKERMTKMASYLTERVNPRLDSLLSTILRSQQNRKPPPLPPPQPTPQPTPPPSIHQQEIIMIEMTKHFPQTKKLSIKVKMIQGKTHRFGKITLQIISSSKSISKHQISEDIVNILSKQLSRDFAPYDTHIQGCLPQEFIQYFILPYVYYQNNQIVIHSHCQGLFKQNLITFLDLECYVFVNHIRANEFRIVICPIMMVESLHINVVINDTIMDQLIKDYEDNYIQDPKIQNLLRVCRGENPIQRRQFDTEIIVKQPVLTNPQLLQGQIPSIILGFQRFMNEYKFCPNKVKMLFKHKKKTYRYFKYVIEEFKVGKGCFYGIRNIQKNKTIDVVLQNMHESFSPTGKIRAKGYHEVEYSLLYFQFGVEDCTKYQIEEVLEVFAMVSELYHLHTYQYELEKDQKQLYGQNAIRVSKLVGRIGKRICTMTDTYVSTITAQVVTINSQIPLGVKVAIFNTENTLSNGFFLRLDKRRWLKQRPKNTNNSLKQSKMSSNRSSTSIFSNRKVKQQALAQLNYLFTPILSTVGFDILMKQLKYYQNKQYFGLKQTLGNPKFGKLEDFLPLNEVIAQYQQVKKLLLINNQQQLKLQKSPNKLYPNS